MKRRRRVARAGNCGESGSAAAVPTLGNSCARRYRT